MEQEMRELRDAVTRIDERTAAILTTQQGLLEFFKTHETRDREDFKEVHTRISQHAKHNQAEIEKLKTKQSWMMGIGAAVVFVITSALAAIKGLFWG